MSTAKTIFLKMKLGVLSVALLSSPLSIFAEDDCTYSKDADMAAQKETCLATSGKTWDCENNRCVYSQATTAMKDTQKECEGIEDATQKKACFDSVAMGAAKDEGLGMENYAKDAAKSAELLGWANLIWGALMGGSKSTCMSVTIMKWTGLASTAGDLYNYFFLSDKVSKLQEEYSKKTVAEKSYDAQKEAFDYLLKEQETIAKVAKQKNIIYTVAAAGYTAAAGMAIYESAMSYMGKAECGTTTDGGAMSCAQVMGKSAGEVKKEQDSLNAKDNLKKAETELDALKKNEAATPADIAAKEAQIKSYKDLIASENPPEAAAETAADASKSTTVEVTDKIKDYGKQVRDNVVSSDPDLKGIDQAKNGLINAGKDIIDPWNLAREAQVAASKSATSEAKDNFDALPQSTRETMQYDYQKDLTEVEQLEVKVLNIRDQEAKRAQIVNLLFRWKEIAKKAAAMGKEEDAKRAADAAKKWAEYLAKPQAANEKVFNIFNTNSFAETPLDFQLGLKRITNTSNDLNTYIAFYEWKRMSEGFNRSFALADYLVLKENTPVYLNLAGHSFKGALVSLLSFNIMAQADAAEMGKKIGGLAGNMAIGILKTQALRFALCALAPKQAMIVSKWLQTPYAVAVMAAASAGVNFQLAGVAKKEKAQAEKNSEIIRKLIANFETSQAAFCPQGRNDINNPQCYCYTDSGERSKHTNSETCQALWAKDDKDYLAKASTDKSQNGGCAYLNGKYDLNCNCTKLIDKNSGENACMKVPKVTDSNTTFSVGNAGKINGLTGAVQTLGSGSTAAAGIDTASLYNNALTQKKVNDMMADNLNQKLKKEGKTPLKLGTEGAKNAWTNGLVPEGTGRNRLMGLSKINDPSFSGKELSPKAKEALINAMKKTGIQYDGGASKNNKSKSDDYSYLFESSNSSKGKVQNFEAGEKKYDYNDNDINTQSGASLFEIISHRFSTSAMRRLFGEQ